MRSRFLYRKNSPTTEPARRAPIPHTGRALFWCAVAAAVVAGCAAQKLTPPPGDLAVQVTAAPYDADVTYKGSPLGRTPMSLSVASVADVVALDAQVAGRLPVEKRVRFETPTQIALSFRFDHPSASVAALGLARAVVFDYSNSATFDFDRADLKPEFSPVLASEADILNTYFPGIDVFVCGYTDSVGAPAYNLELSLKRAQAVSDFLRGHQVAKERMRIQGFGADYPVESNGTKEGRALNRRTEVLLPQ